jgi:rRNA-processing protein FCF1
MTVLYIETNFLMRIAQGQEPLAQALLSSPPANVQIHIPAPCCMEAFSTIKRYRSKRNYFEAEISKEFKDLKDNQASVYAGQLLASLQVALIASQNLLNDSQSRLFLAMQDIANHATIFPLTKSALSASIDPEQAYIEDPTDNLILHCILDHAQTLTNGPHAFVTKNTRDFKNKIIEQLLYDNGEIYYFSDTRSFQSWFGAGCQKKTRP